MAMLKLPDLFEAVAKKRGRLFGDVQNFQRAADEYQEVRLILMINAYSISTLNNSDTSRPRLTMDLQIKFEC
jgi:hypothetical protein